MSETERTRIIGYLSEDTLDQGGLPRAILPDEGHLLSSLDGHIHIGEDGMITVLLRQPLDDHGVSSRSDGREEREVHRLTVDLFDLDTLDLLQLFDPTLHLVALGRLVAEALDEALEILELLLLILIGPALLLETLFTKLEVVGIVRLIVM